MSAYQGQTHFSNLITHGENLAGFMNMQVLPRIDRNSRWDAVMVGASRMDDPVWTACPCRSRCPASTPARGLTYTTTQKFAVT